MKKIWTRISSAVLAALILFSAALPVSAYTSKDLASDEKTDTPYYANYTLTSFMRCLMRNWSRFLRNATRTMKTFNFAVLMRRWNNVMPW